MKFSKGRDTFIYERKMFRSSSFYYCTRENKTIESLISGYNKTKKMLSRAEDNDIFGACLMTNIPSPYLHVLRDF
jgi:hypothetical protein